ncbi:hypothetical protein QQ045_017721 [Rhodiola kirilowii]
MATRLLSRSRCRVLRTGNIFSSSSSSSTAAAAILPRHRPSITAARVMLLTARRFCTSEKPPTFANISSPSDGRGCKSNQPNVRREDIMLDGCDFEHWLIMMQKPEGDPSREEIIDSYIKTLTQIVGSEEEAKMKIYSVSTKHYYAFSCLLSEEVAKKLNDLPGVSWVLPDAYMDIKNKDYGGEPFINGQAVPYDPKYHEEWVRNNSRAKEKASKSSGDRSRGGNRNRPPTSGNMTPNENNSGAGAPDGGRAI